MNLFLSTKQPLFFRILIAVSLTFMAGFLPTSLGHAEWIGIDPIEKGTVIDIGPWDAKHRVFEVIDVEESGAGPFYATPEEIAKAFRSNAAFRLDSIIRNPKSIVGMRVSTESNLPIWPEPEEWENGGPYPKKKSENLKGKKSKAQNPKSKSPQGAAKSALPEASN